VKTRQSLERGDHLMKRQRPRARIKAANDNSPVPGRVTARPPLDLPPMPFIPPRYAVQLAPPEPFRIGARPLLIVGFSALVLVVLCSAFLIGLAVVGLLAVVIVACELIRGLSRPARPPLGALDHQVVG
jgi:hypothetical protein